MVPSSRLPVRGMATSAAAASLPRVRCADALRRRSSGLEASTSSRGPRRAAAQQARVQPDLGLSVSPEAAGGLPKDADEAPSASSRAAGARLDNRPLSSHASGQETGGLPEDAAAGFSAATSRAGAPNTGPGPGGGAGSERGGLDEASQVSSPSVPSGIALAEAPVVRRARQHKHQLPSYSELEAAAASRGSSAKAAATAAGLRGDEARSVRGLCSGFLQGASDDAAALHGRVCMAGLLGRPILTAGWPVRCCASLLTFAWHTYA